MEISNKDIYEYIVGLADDRTVLNMLAVNKKFNDDSYFRKILEKRYPTLLLSKQNNESYKHFYLRTVKDLATLWEEYKIPYIPAKTFIPGHLLKLARSRVFNPYTFALMDAVRTGDLKLVQYLLDKGGKISDISYTVVGRQGNVEMLEFLMSKFTNDQWLRRTLSAAKEYNNREIVHYLEKIGIEE